MKEFTIERKIEIVKTIISNLVKIGYDEINNNIIDYDNYLCHHYGIVVYGNLRDYTNIDKEFPEYWDMIINNKYNNHGDSPVWVISNTKYKNPYYSVKRRELKKLLTRLLKQK